MKQSSVRDFYVLHTFEKDNNLKGNIKMVCNCRCNINHRVETVVNTGTAIALELTDTTNIGDLERFNLVVNSLSISPSVTGDPLPITTTINGIAGIPVKNSLAQPLMSNVVPLGKTCGRFVMGGDTTTAADSYVILKTPCYA